VKIEGACRIKSRRYSASEMDMKEVAHRQRDAVETKRSSRWEKWILSTIRHAETTRRKERGRKKDAPSYLRRAKAGELMV